MTEQHVEATNTSIEQLTDLSGNIMYYPNPAGSKVSIRFTGKVHDEANVIITDMQG